MVEVLPNLASELAAALAIARQAGQLALTLRTNDLAVEHKSGDEPVTAADRAANALIVDALHAQFPNDGMLSEEAPDDGSRLQAARVWMVDPIDGTRDFVRGRDGFSTMIGLLSGDLPVLGVVYQPSADRIYYAVRGEGAFMQIGNAAPTHITVSDIRDVSALRMVSSRSHREPLIEKVRQELGIVDEMSIGSVGLKLGLIARGDRELYVNPSGHTKLWDTCGPEAILLEAGGQLSDTTGAPLRYRDANLANHRGLIATNRHLHLQVVERLAQLLGR